MTELPSFPLRMMRRPRDARGLPVPYSQFVAADGTPDFRVLDADKVSRCLRLRLCGLCGEQMGRHLFFIGGPLCIENGFFNDPPMHRQCAEFALRICAHLNRTKGKYSAAPLPIEPGVKVVTVEAVSNQKADWFALMRTARCEQTRMPDGMVFIRAKLPWIEVVRWRDGKPMEQVG